MGTSDPSIHDLMKLYRLQSRRQIKDHPNAHSDTESTHLDHDDHCDITTDIDRHDDHRDIGRTYNDYRDVPHHTVRTTIKDCYNEYSEYPDYNDSHIDQTSRAYYQYDEPSHWDTRTDEDNHTDRHYDIAYEEHHEDRPRVDTHIDELHNKCYDDIPYEDVYEEEHGDTFEVLPI